MSKPIAILLAAGLVAAAAATPAQAHHEPRHGVRYSGPSQYDRPGDFRCDAYWDRGRDDCDAAWRDQRRYTSRGHGHRYRSHGYGGNWGHAAGSATYEGAYGRPDHVYPGHGYRPRAGGGRDPHRVAWCRHTYRSYDPNSGYYRTYDGRLTFCG